MNQQIKSEGRGADKGANVGAILAAVDTTFDALLKKLGCVDGNDARIISHWQEDSFLVSVTRKSDGRSLYRTVRLSDAAILPPLSSEHSLGDKR